MPKNKHSELGSKLIKSAEKVRDYYVNADKSNVKVQNREHYTFIPSSEYSGNDVKKIRVNAKLTQQGLADLLSTTVDTVRKWEQNRSHPSGPAVRVLQMLEMQGIPECLIANA